MRLDAVERAAWNKLRCKPHGKMDEPAMGSLDERLDIIIRRLGGTTTKPRMTYELRTQIADCRLPDAAF